MDCFVASLLAMTKEALLALARELLHSNAKLFRVHAVDDGVALGVELLLDRRRGSAMDQRFRGCNAGRRGLCKPLRELAGGGLQFRGRHDPGDQAPLMGLLRRKTVLGEIYLQRAAGADGGDHADGSAAVGRDAELGISRREAGVL